MPLHQDADIANLLTNMRSIAVVGASDDPAKASYGVMQRLIAQGYDVYPVNPRLAGQKILGQNVAADLASLPAPVDMVDVFRRSEDVPAVVDAAIAAGARAVWMQLGVIHAEAAAKAETAGLDVVMDRCPKIELARLHIAPRPRDH